MKDIKLTIEDIKKGCEYADGFKYTKEKIDMLGECNLLWIGRIYCFINDSFTNTDYKDIYYPLFLQRVIEGINKDNIGSFKISQRDNEIILSNYITNEIYKIYPVKFFKGDMVYQPNKAKIKAIKYILDKLK